MGRIKTTLVKRTSLKLFNEFRPEFGKDFSENKKKVARVAEINSKKLVNCIAGYITRLVKITKEI